MEDHFLILGATLFPFASNAGVARPELTNHVIAADQDGIAIHPDTEEPFSTVAEFEAFVNGILDRAEEMARARDGRRTGRVPVKILVHVHGGLNSSSQVSGGFQPCSAGAPCRSWPVTFVR